MYNIFVVFIIFKLRADVIFIIIFMVRHTRLKDSVWAESFSFLYIYLFSNQIPWFLLGICLSQRR